jgi:hypothetical protein
MGVANIEDADNDSVDTLPLCASCHKAADANAVLRQFQILTLGENRYDDDATEH